MVWKFGRSGVDGWDGSSLPIDLFQDEVEGNQRVVKTSVLSLVYIVSSFHQ